MISLPIQICPCYFSNKIPHVGIHGHVGIHPHLCWLWHLLHNIHRAKPLWILPMVLGVIGSSEYGLSMILWFFQTTVELKLWHSTTVASSRFHCMQRMVTVVLNICNIYDSQQRPIAFSFSQFAVVLWKTGPCGQFWKVWIQWIIY